MLSFSGSICRLAAIDGSDALDWLSRVLGLRRLLLPDDPQQLVEARPRPAARRSKGVLAGEQLVEQHAERVDVAAGVDVQLR